MFTIDRHVSYSDISSEGYADISKIAEYFQDCASFQSDSLGGGADVLRNEKGCVWLLGAWQIVVDRYPEYSERLTVCTKPYGFSSVFANRNFMIYDEKGSRIVVANSYWFLLDVNTGMPLRMRDDVSSVYTTGQREEMDYAPRKLKSSGISDRKEPFRVGKACIDTNQHMNNAWYIRLAMEYLPDDFRIRQVRAEYCKAAVYGDMINVFTEISDGTARVLMADADKDTYAVLEFTAQED